MIERWQALVGVVAAVGGASVWAADQRWATKDEARADQANHAKLHDEEAATRALMMTQLTQTRDEMAALREDIAFLRCFLDPKTDWDSFKQACVERPNGTLPTLAGRVPALPASATMPTTTSAGHPPAPTAETAPQ